MYMRQLITILLFFTSINLSFGRIQDDCDVPTPKASVIPIPCTAIPEDIGILIITYPIVVCHFKGDRATSKFLHFLTNHNRPKRKKCNFVVIEFLNESSSKTE